MWLLLTPVALIALALVFAWRHDRRHRADLRPVRGSADVPAVCEARSQSHLRGLQGSGPGYGP